MMMTLLNIKQAITALLRSKYPTYEVYFDNIEKAKAPYFYVEMIPTVSAIDRTYSDRDIQIDIELVLAQDGCGRVKRSDLYVACDTLDALVRPVLQVGDRYITIQNAESSFVSEVLHYIFDLTFTDAFTDAEIGGIQYELMEELGLNLKGEI